MYFISYQSPFIPVIDTSSPFNSNPIISLSKFAPFLIARLELTFITIPFISFSAALISALCTNVTLAMVDAITTKPKIFLFCT